MLGGLGVSRDHVGGDVRRVAHDGVDGPVEPGQGRAQVAEHEVDAVGREVALGPRVRELRELHGVDLAAGVLVGDRRGNGSRSGAEVDDDGPPGALALPRLRWPEALREPVEHELHDALRLRPWDEDSRPDGEREMPEVRDPGQVLEGNAACALGHEVPEGLPEPLGHRSARDGEGPQPAEAAAEQVLGELLGVGPGARHAGLGEQCRGGAQGRAEVGAGALGHGRDRTRARALALPRRAHSPLTRRGRRGAPARPCRCTTGSRGRGRRS